MKESLMKFVRSKDIPPQPNPSPIKLETIEVVLENGEYFLHADGERVVLKHPFGGQDVPAKCDLGRKECRASLITNAVEFSWEQEKGQANTIGTYVLHADLAILKVFFELVSIDK